MTITLNPESLEKAAKAAAAVLGDDDWSNLSMFLIDANDTVEECQQLYRDMAGTAVTAYLEAEAGRQKSPALLLREAYINRSKQWINEQ